MLSKEELRKKAQGTEQKQNTSSKKTNSSKILSQEELVKKANVKYKITQKDVDFVNSLYKSVNNYVDSYNTDIKNLNFNTASELRDKYAQQGEALRKQAEAVKNTVKYLDLQPLEQEQITKDIDEMLLNIGKGSNLLGEAVDMYSQFGNEEEYNQAINFIDFMSDDKKAENEKKKKQQEAMADIIDRYERSKYENYSINPLKETPVAGPQGVIKELAKNGIVFDDLQIVNGDISKFEADLKRKYEEISGEIASYEGMVRAFEFEKTVQDYKTKFAEDGTIKKWQETGSKDYASFVAYNGEMTEDEKEIYNVLAERAGQKIQSYSTESSAHNTYVVVDGKYLKSYEEQIEYKYADKDVAKDLKISVDEWKKIKGYVKEFLDYSEYLKDAIAQRKGVKIAEGLKGKTILEELYSLWGGINNFGQGVSTAITKDTRPSATTYASAMVRDDLVKNNGKWGSLYGLLYDTGTSVGQMLPSIALAYATGGASSAFGAGAETAKLVSGLTFKTSFGASAYGNAYSEMINAGYREGQAKAYATMSAASEVLLQDLLGGIGKFSGKLTNSAMQKVIENIDNAFLKVVASGTVSALGEFTEESLQEIVSPIFKTLVTQDIDPIKWGDVIYAGVMGALTSVAMNAPAGIAGGAQNIVQKISNSGFALTQKGVKNLSVTRDIYDFASTMPEYTTAYKLSQVASKGGNAYNMVSELAHQKKPLTEAQSEALKNRLTEDGYTPELASKIVDSAVKVSNNISVMSEQKKAIQENAILTSAILEVVTEADAKTLGISEQFNKRTEETVYAREEVHKKTTENIVKTAEEGGKTITTEEASTKGRNAVKAPKNATVRKISDVVLSKANNPEITDEQIKKNEKVIMDIGKALGRKIIIEDESTATNDKEQKISVNGYFDEKTGEIHLSRNAKRPIEWILKHEITHSGERTKAYDDFVKKIVKTEVYAEWLRGRTGVDASVDVMEAMLGDEVRQIYAEKGVELGKKQGKITEARQEIIADFVGDMLFNSDTSNLENFLNQLDKPTRNKFIQWVLDVIDKIKNAFAKGDKKLLNEITTLERQFADMLKDAGKETEKKGAKNDNTNEKKLSLEEENIIDLSKDNELSKRIGTLTGSKKYKVIKLYIQEVLGNQPIIMNDGKKVIVDNTDANHISNKAWDKKTAEISEIKKLIESAKLWAEDKSPTHSKFNYFCYYKADVRYENEVFPIYLNVGRTINDKTYHLYDITNKIKDTADRINGLERPKPNEGYALRNGISKSNISQEKTSVKQFSLEGTDVAKFKPIARQLMRNNQIDGNVEELAKVLKKSFIDVSNDDVGSYEGVMPAVKWLQKNAKETIRLDEYTKDVLSSLRRLNVYLDDVQKNEVVSAFDSYGDFRKKLMGSITISKQENAIQSLDSAWQDLSAMYPNIFDADTNSADMPAALLMAVNDLRSGKFNAEDGSVETDEADLISQVYESYLENLEKFEDNKPVSDYAEQVDELNEKLENEEITKDEYKAEINRLFKEAGEKYGTIRQGESVTGNENFEDAVPQSVAKGTKMRQYARTVTEATKDPTLDNILTTEQKKQILSDARMHYVPTSNKENIQKALSKVARGEGRETWLSTVKGEKPATSVDIAFGELLLESAIENGDAGHVLQYTAELAELGARLGQAVQAFSLLKRMGGLGKLLYVQQAVKTLNKDLEQRINSKKFKEVKINEALAMQLAESKTEEDFAISYEAIMRDIASQVPSTFLDKWNAWRYMAMLANPITVIRNIAGNAFFVPVRTISDVISRTAQLGIKTDNKTATFVVPKKYRDFAIQNFSENKKGLMSGGKYNVSSEIDEYRTIFNSPLEKVRKLTNWMLENDVFGDGAFIKRYYVSALSEFLAARKVNLNNISKETLAAAQKHAAEKALKSTYRDTSTVAQVLSQLSKNKYYGFLVEGVLPFKKTPINILKRGIEYSPIGFVTTIGNALYNVKTGKWSATQFIDGLASATTGTGLFVLGMWLSALGVASAGFDDEDELWKKLIGEQEYALKIGGVSYTFDWMAPAGIPFFMGAAVYEDIQRQTNGSMDIWSIIGGSAGSALDVMTETSMLSSISDLISNFRFAESDAEGLINILSSSAGSFIMQHFPTLFGKINNTIDDTRREYFVDKTKGFWEQTIDAIGEKTLPKIPFASSQRLPYVNAFGEEEKTGGVARRIFQNFVSPGYISFDKSTDVTDLISNVYETTGDSDVLPERAPKKFKFKGITKNLTEDEYYKYSTGRGQKNADYLAEMVENEKFLQLTTEQQVKVIKNLYEFSDAYSKSLLDYTYDDIVAMDVVNVTEEEYNKLSKETKTALAKAFFLKSYGNETKIEINGGSVVDYYVDQEIKTSKTPQKEKKKQSVSEAIKNFS